MAQGDKWPKEGDSGWGSAEHFGNMQTNIAVLETEVRAIKSSVETLVTRPEFTPIKLLVYGFSASILSAVVVAIIALVIRR